MVVELAERLPRAVRGLTIQPEPADQRRGDLQIGGVEKTLGDEILFRAIQIAVEDQPRQLETHRMFPAVLRRCSRSGLPGFVDAVARTIQSAAQPLRVAGDGAE